jgi:hypothetical protein
MMSDNAVWQLRVKGFQRLKHVRAALGVCAEALTIGFS